MKLRPTPAEYQAFGDYLCEAHSWYKHLPLMVGRRFVVFVAPDAGIGRLVAVPRGGSVETMTGYSLVTPPEGSEFTDAHPRLHYSWKTTNEYRSRFGFLDYMCDEPYRRDAGPLVALPARVKERCSFVLYPYVSVTFAEAVTWSVHADAIAELRSGAAHPARDDVLELARRADALALAWNTLGDKERELMLSRRFDCESAWPSEVSIELRNYLDLDDGVNSIFAALRDREVQKIQRALAELDRCLPSGE